MIAGVRFAANPGIDARRAETLPERPVDQEVIDPEASVPLPVLPKVVPERENRLIGVQRSNRIDPALIQKALPASATFRL